MARDDDRTEKPTPKRKREARRKGQVARSPDVSSWAVLFTASFLVPALFRSAESRVVGLFAQATDVMADPSPGAALGVLQAGLLDVLRIVLPVAGGLAAVGVAANVAQTGLAFSLHAAAPRFEHLNPVAGIKRLVSVQSLWQLGKQVVRLTVLVAVAYRAVSGLGHQLVGTQPVGLGRTVPYAAGSILGLVRDVAGLGLVLALADYGIQRRRHLRSLRMTRQEVRDEARQTEGDPLLRRQIRRQQVRMSRSRMMAAVAGADVVVTNPTHYAVALRYEPGGGQAPRVVAKGADQMARRIREEAARHHVPVVEDPPLARAVYAVCEVDDQIPRDLYVAVARLLAFVLTLPALVRASEVVHRRPTTALVA